MNELLAHLVGDYIFQSHWMATEKTKKLYVAFIHAVAYTIPFLFITRNVYALLIICVTHAIIDRYRLATWVGKIKNWNFTTANGYPEETPVWLTVWLTIIVDNTMHLLINHFALQLFTSH